MTKIISIPTVHLNGTSRQTLIDDYSKASSAIFSAIGDLAAAAPNARDYYPQGPTAYATARAQHEDRIKRLSAVRAELVEVIEAIEA